MQSAPPLQFRAVVPVEAHAQRAFAAHFAPGKVHHEGVGRQVQVGQHRFDGHHVNEVVAHPEVPLDGHPVQLDGLAQHLVQAGHQFPHRRQLAHAADKHSAGVGLDFREAVWPVATPPGYLPPVADPGVPALQVAGHGHVRGADESRVRLVAEERLDVMNFRQPVRHIDFAHTRGRVAQTHREDVLGRSVQHRQCCCLGHRNRSRVFICYRL
jgi:hypothetical protein